MCIRDRFCIEFGVDYELERAVWLEAAENRIREEGCKEVKEER